MMLKTNKQENSLKLFKTKCIAVHGNTAAKVIFNRVDSEKENIGLTNKNYFIDMADEEIWDVDLQCVDMYYYSKDLKK